jgi:hypothetical protein
VIGHATTPTFADGGRLHRVIDQTEENPGRAVKDALVDSDYSRGAELPRFGRWAVIKKFLERY